MKLPAAVLFALAPALLSAQSRYGSSPTWWDAGRDSILSWEETYENPTGLVSVLNSRGPVHTKDHAFFEPLGPNGRACITCHQPASAMSISAAVLRERWIETQGKDPVFAAIDGANCPDLPQSDRASHSLLLNDGLFRIGLPWPPKDVQPDFRIEVLRDPTGCNTASRREISVYRRPRIAANLQYVLQGPEGLHFMADGRERSLAGQAATAAMVHEQADAPPAAAQLRQIVEFESQIFAAQSADIRGGLLNEQDGPAVLGPQNIAAGKGGIQAGMAVLGFDPWRRSEGGLQREFRASVARGSDLFFGRGTCASCHNSSTTRWMDIGTTQQEASSGSLPLFRVVCEGGRTIETHDPGRALITGKCADVGAIMLQQLRGLAARAPYFANGSARTLRDVVDYYDHRLHIGFTDRDKQDLVNFLSAL
jgi:cytochrome c peroxidase